MGRKECPFTRGRWERAGVAKKEGGLPISGQSQLEIQKGGGGVEKKETETMWKKGLDGRRESKRLQGGEEQVQFK